MGSLAFYVLTGPVIANTIQGILIESAGVFLALHAIYVVRLRNINIAPIVKHGGELVKTGPYSIIRHPMYIAQIVALIPLLVEHYSLSRLIVLIILTITLLLKINYEEKQLVMHFADYEDYMKKTWRMLPYIY